MTSLVLLLCSPPRPLLPVVVVLVLPSILPLLC
jgi:hypothetical protein